MRTAIFDRDKKTAREIMGLDNRPTLIVFGGGSGSKIINKNIRDAAFDICRQINIIHICGRGNKVESNIYGYKQIEFADDMGLIYACADGAVARCGSNSANELISLKIPTLFIPLQNSSSRGDQVKNAEYFCDKGVCRVLSEKQLSPNCLKQEIYKLLNDAKLKAALDKNCIECGNERIIKEIKAALR